MKNLGLKVHARLAASAAVVALSAGAALAGPVDISLPAQPLADSLTDISQRTGENILFQSQSTAGIRAKALNGRMTPQEAIQKLIQGTGLKANSDGRAGVVVERESFTEPTAPEPKLGRQDTQLTQAGQGAPASQGEAEPTEQVVVSGTRIVRDGYSAPTPVTVVGAEQLATSATNNIADYVNSMPAFFGSQTPQNSTHSSSNAMAGLNVLNLRNLGGIRTLVLIDGQRSVGSTTTGLVDINNIPQDLVTRVDVVTGGASAAYGSDALAGVVNFVLDKTYEGTKGEVSGGVTTYGDDWNYRIRLTKGIGFDGGRGHLIVSGEFSDDTGVRGVPRAWNNTGAEIINNPAYTATNGQPQLLALNHVGVYAAAFGGTIDSTALAGTTFGPGGTPRTINFGPIVSNPYTVGGDWASLQANGAENLIPSLVNQRIFTRASYDITDNITIFGEFSWAGSRSKGVNEPIFYTGNLTIKADNAFIPPSTAARANALGISQFTFGSLNGDLPPWSNNTYRTTSRYVLGAEGKFDAFGSNWSWNSYYQDGKTISEFQAKGVPLTANYTAAIDAVTNPATGSIICRSTLTNPNNGCVPYDLFGTGVNTQAAVNYVEPGNPAQHLNLEEQVWSATLNGEPFSDWAGPVSLATGVEHRSEALNVTADPLAGGWYGANFVPARGHYSVTEGFIETVVPLARDVVFAKSLDVNAAMRATDYSTSGYVTTWKVGATWDVTSDIRIRATRSRDIRAPNLSELFQTGSGQTQPLVDDFHGRVQVQAQNFPLGNLGLRPETSDGTGAGVVVQPSFLPGFSASADYWEMDIKSSITSISPQNTIDLCYEGFTGYCGLITPNLATVATPPALIKIITEPTNLASQTASGIDFEADYHFDLADIVSGWNGNVTLRYLGTHYISNVNNNSLTPPVQIVGSSLPKWRHNISVMYSGDPFTFVLTGRLTSAGVLDRTYIQCSSGCPTSTTNNPTIDNDYEPGSFYLDTSITYNFEGPGSLGMQAYLNIQNILNADPAIIPQGPTGIAYETIQTNPTLYDILGRTFRVGLRFGL